MILCFELSMPGVSSWNGKWSGEDDYYAIVKTLRNTNKNQEIVERVLKNNYYTYRWSDGWCAAVEVKQVNSIEARRARKKSKGFCGYNWMVDSIIRYGKIYASHEIPTRKEK